MMALGAVVGLTLGAAYLGLVLDLSFGKHAWFALASAEVVQVWFGARWARRRLGHSPTNDQRFRMAFWYSIVELALGTGVFLTVVLSLGAQHWLDGTFALLTTAAAPGSVVLVAMVFVSVCFTILLRYLLLTAFASRRAS